MNFLLRLRSFASLLRWRLKPVRWIVKMFAELRSLPRSATLTRPKGGFQSSIFDALLSQGYGKVATAIDFPAVDIKALAGRAVNKSFIDVSADFPEEVAQAYIQVMSVPGVQDAVLRYFDGRPWLWNVALNYSDASERRSDSQLWHFDYGDSKQLHFMAYFSDVDTASGPFTFLPADKSNRVSRHPLLIERYTDEQLLKKFEIDVSTDAIRLEGRRGEVFVVDPGRAMHQGARCSKPRLVMFITFTTPAPMSRGGGATISAETRERLWSEVARSGKAIIPIECYR